MEKLNFLLLMVVLLPFLAGCDGESNPSTPFRGTQGLSMEFHPNSPPSSVNPGRSFNIIIYISNKGASDITDGQIYLTNIIDDDIQIEGSKSKTFTLYGRTELISEGEKKAVSWDAKATSKDANIMSKIGAAAEYGYATKAVTPICIDPQRDTDIGVDKTAKPCIMQQELGLSDQGAPIAVKKIITDIDQDRNQVILTIEVQNVGGGYVSAGTVGSTRLGFLDSEVKLAGQPLRCESSRIEMVQDTGEIVCYASYASQTAYTTTLQVNLRYVYRQLLQPKEIEIRKTTVIPQ